MKSFNKKGLLVTGRVVSLLLAATVLVTMFAGCGSKQKPNKTNKGNATPEAIVTTYSEANSRGDFKTAENCLLYIYDEVMVAATGKYPSAEEYRKTAYACSGNEEYYEIIEDWTSDFLEDTYGEGYTVKATVESCEKLDSETTQNIKDYYTKFYEACDLNSEDFFNIEAIEEIYVATCKCDISGDLEESSIDEVYLIYKIGENYKLIQCNGVTEDNVMPLIENIPARTTQLEGLVGQGAFKDQPSFNEYFYILGLQKQ